MALLRLAARPLVGRLGQLIWAFSFCLGQPAVLRAEEPVVEGARRPATFTDAQYQQQIRAIRKRLPDEKLQIVVEAPFVVVGNGSADDVQRWATGTIRWAVGRLKSTYFQRDPNRILTIWLFQDKPSYERLNEELFGKKPGTPFGYYSSADNALVMNISTGGGTLVHEIVHPFMEANFPQCPAWLNEGLGSLYEQCGDREGKITGFTNWRLAGLQQAIRADSVPSFEKLCSTSDAEFYHADPGTNYSQARYLCYYLQEEGLLQEFYQAFHKNHRQDPSGYKTLCAVLGDPQIDAFESAWRKYVLRLRFP